MLTLWSQLPWDLGAPPLTTHLFSYHQHEVGKLPFFADRLLRHRDLAKVKLKLIAEYRGKPNSLQSQSTTLPTGSHFFLAVNIILD